MSHEWVMIGPVANFLSEMSEMSATIKVTKEQADALCRYLDDAYERGRQSGLEEGAKVAEQRAYLGGFVTLDGTSELLVMNSAIDDAARAIRSLKDKEP